MSHGHTSSSWMSHGHTSVGEPLSPELALVSPELAERARALLSDRPWEQFAPPRPPEPERPPQRLRPPARPAEWVLVEEAPRVEAVAPTPAPQDAWTSRKPRRPTRGHLGTVLAAAVVLGVLVIGSLPIVPNGPVLEAALVTEAPSPQSPSPTMPTSSEKKPSSPSPSSPSSPRTTPPNGSKVRPAATARTGPAPIGHSGYAAGRTVTFRSNEAGSALLDLSVVGPDCGSA